MRGPSVVAALLGACTAPAEEPVLPTGRLNYDVAAAGVEPEPTTPTTTPPPADLTAVCNPTENALRFVCTVSSRQPRPVALSFAKRDDESAVRTVVSEGDSLQHTLDLYFLAPDTTYAWTAIATDDPSVAAVAGTFTTGELPAGAQAAFTINEGLSSSPKIGMVSPCNDGAFAVILDPRSNEVLWYQDFASSPLGFIDGVVFTEDETILAIADGMLIEVDLMGNRLLELVPAVDLPYRVHHDVYRKNGLTYALFQEVVVVGDGDFLMDGFYVIDAGGAILAEWHLSDHFLPIAEPEPSPFAQDFSHANAIWVDDDQNILVSFRHLSAIAMIEGDLASADFGTVQWRLANPESEFGSDFALTSLVGPPADFEQQHNVHYLPDGSLVMLDNRVGYTELSRVIQLTVDPAKGEASIDRQFSLPRHCDFQGGAMLTPLGNLLATCAPTRDGYEFDDASGAVTWHGNASCTLGFGSYIPRFVPLEW